MHIHKYFRRRKNFMLSRSINSTIIIFLLCHSFAQRYSLIRYSKDKTEHVHLVQTGAKSESKPPKKGCFTINNDAKNEYFCKMPQITKKKTEGNPSYRRVGTAQVYKNVTTMIVNNFTGCGPHIYKYTIFHPRNTCCRPILATCS